MSTDSTKSYPTSLNELEEWCRTHQTTITEGRTRLVQFIILTCIAEAKGEISKLAFKGGNALRFVHGNDRSTSDLDFSAEADFPDTPEEIRTILNAMLVHALKKYSLKAEFQSARVSECAKIILLASKSVELRLLLPRLRPYYRSPRLS